MYLPVPDGRDTTIVSQSRREYKPSSTYVSNMRLLLHRRVCGRTTISCSARTSTYTPGRLLLAGLVPLACLTLIVCWMHHVLPVGIPLALALWAVVVWCWQRQARSLAFHADTLMVRWLGRSHACNGLHALAERRPASRRGHWGESSLAERIERVCGMPVEARENRLTLVR